jgi:hypothetical protein
MPNEFALYFVRKLEINPSCSKNRFSLGIDANNNERSFVVTLKFDVTTLNTKKNEIVSMYGDPFLNFLDKAKGDKGKYASTLMSLCCWTTMWLCS